MRHIVILIAPLALLCGCSGPSDAPAHTTTVEPRSNAGERCRSDSDCHGVTVCVPPGATHACGVPCMAQRTCESSTDCTGDLVCAEFVGGCCFAGERSSACRPRCTGTSCAEGERCDEATGLCAIIACDDGFECAQHTRCRRGEAAADVHGCVRDACAGDAECSGGVCVSGLCYESAGTCTGPAA